MIHYIGRLENANTSDNNETLMGLHLAKNFKKQTGIPCEPTMHLEYSGIIKWQCLISAKVTQQHILNATLQYIITKTFFQLGFILCLIIQHKNTHIGRHVLHFQVDHKCCKKLNCFHRQSHTQWPKTCMSKIQYDIRLLHKLKNNKIKSHK